MAAVFFAFQIDSLCERIKNDSSEITIQRTDEEITNVNIELSDGSNIIRKINLEWSFVYLTAIHSADMFDEISDNWIEISYHPFVAWNHINVQSATCPSF